MRQSAADPVLYQLDWSHLASLLPPWGCPAWRRDGGGGGQAIVGQEVGSGSWGPNTGYEALAKSNMAVFVFAGRAPSVCFCLACPQGLPAQWAEKLFEATLFLYSAVSSVAR